MRVCFALQSGDALDLLNVDVMGCLGGGFSNCLLIPVCISFLLALEPNQGLSLLNNTIREGEEWNLRIQESSDIPIISSSLP